MRIKGAMMRRSPIYFRLTFGRAIPFASAASVFKPFNDGTNATYDERWLNNVPGATSLIQRMSFICADRTVADQVFQAFTEARIESVLSEHQVG